MAVYAKWYFDDEAYQDNGPFDSEKDAKEAELLYFVVELNGGGSDEQKARYKSLLAQNRS